jgi:hypothetical protein
MLDPRSLRLADLDPPREQIVYAGDDENDALEEIAPEQIAAKARGGAA